MIHISILVMHFCVIVSFFSNVFLLLVRDRHKERALFTRVAQSNQHKVVSADPTEYLSTSIYSA